MALTNNDILKKLRVALKLRDHQIVDILKLVNYETTKSEIGAFFRNEDHPKYMPVMDQFLRNFLNGLVIHMRGPMEKKLKEEDRPTPKKEVKKVEAKKPVSEARAKRPRTVISRRPKKD